MTTKPTLTRVILEGALGKEFGREWNLSVRNAGEALRLVNANSPGVYHWIRRHLDIYASYQVVCEFGDGSAVEIGEEELWVLPQKPTVIRFVPLVEGAGAAARIIAGVVLIVASYWLGGTTAAQGSSLIAGAAHVGMAIGASLAIGGLVSMLTPIPQVRDASTQERKDRTSYYFDGPVNTNEQGTPVPLIYGREVLVGSQAISASLTIDQLT